MAEEDTLETISATLFKSQITALEKILRHNKKRYGSASGLLRHAVDFFLNSRKLTKFDKIKEFMLFLGYPVIIMSILLYITRSMNNIEIILSKNELFLAELSYLNNIITILGFATLSITFSLMVLWKTISNKRGETLSGKK